MGWTPPMRAWVDSQLRALGVSQAGFCRVHRLPQGTDLGAEPEHVALLRLCVACPWLMGVADDNYTRCDEALDAAAKEAREYLDRPTIWDRISSGA